jgi:hypothetical protein
MLNRYFHFGNIGYSQIPQTVLCPIKSWEDFHRERGGTPFLDCDWHCKRHDIRLCESSSSRDGQSRRIYRRRGAGEECAKEFSGVAKHSAPAGGPTRAAPPPASCGPTREDRLKELDIEVES